MTASWLSTEVAAQGLPPLTAAGQGLGGAGRGRLEAFVPAMPTGWQSLMHAPSEGVDPAEIEHLALAEALFLASYQA